MPKARLLEKGLLYQEAVTTEEVTTDSDSVTTRVLCIYEGSWTSSGGSTTKYTPALIDKMAAASNDYLDKGNRIPLFDANHDENGYSRKDQIGLVTGPFTTGEITEDLLPHPGMKDELLGKYALFSEVEIIGEDSVEAYQKGLIKNISIALYLSKGGMFPQYVIYEISCVVWGAVFGASLYSLGVEGIITLALVLPPDVANKVAVEGGYPPEELHLSLAELKTSDVEDTEALSENIQKFADGHAPVIGSIGGVGRLTGEASDLLYLDFVSTELNNFVQSLPEVTPTAYSSKIAIASLEATKLTPLFRVEPIALKFEALTLTIGQARSDFPFKSQVEPSQQNICENLANKTNMNGTKPQKRPLKGEKKEYAFTVEAQERLLEAEWDGYDEDDSKLYRLWNAFRGATADIKNATPEELPESATNMYEKAIAYLSDRLRAIFQLNPEGGQNMSGTPDKSNRPESPEPSQHQKDMEAKYSKLEQEKDELAEKVAALEKHKELTANYNAHKERARTLLDARKMTPAQYNELFEPTEGKDGLQTYAAVGSDRVGFLLDQIDKHSSPLVKFQSALDGQPLPQRNGQMEDDVDGYLERTGKK